jgi:hypothetical protein
MPPHQNDVALGLGQVLLGGPVDVAPTQRSFDTEL